MTTVSAARHGVAAGAARSGLRRAWNDHRTYRATLAALAALSDRELQDVGLHRDTLARVARDAVYGN